MTTTAKRDSMEVTVDKLGSEMKNTTLNQSTSSDKPIGLTRLPPSVRNNIYKHVLDTELVNVGKPNVSYTHSIKDGVLQFKASRPPFSIQTALFYVNKQISQEAIRYFYSKNLFVRFEIYTADARHAKTMVEDSGLLFSVASPDKVTNSTQHAMDLTLVEKVSSQKRVAVMFPAQYLPRLVNFLDQASKTTSIWASTHSLFITVLNTYHFPVFRVQGDLLELFRLLSNLGSATIDPENLLPGYAEGLQTNITSPLLTADNWLATVTEMVDRANEAREKQDYALATQHSQSAIIAMTYGFLTHAELLHSQGEAFHKSMQRLRWRCELGLGNSLHAQHRTATSSQTWLTDTEIPLATRRTVANDMLLAETSISHALSLATDSPSPASNPWFKSLPVELIPPNKPTWFTDEEKGMTWYALGVVHMGLGEYLFAAGDLERASGLWKSQELEKEFERAREGIDWEKQPGKGLKGAMNLVKTGSE